MQQVNRYYKSAKISEAKFRHLLRLFALDLTASDAARLTGLSRISTPTRYQRLRQYLVRLRQVPAELQGTVEVDESYFGPRRVRGKRGGQNEFARGTQHSNGIESFWSFAKRRLVQVNGGRPADFATFLFESEMRFNFRRQDLDKFLLASLKTPPL